jgi:hypothetical protein
MERRGDKVTMKELRPRIQLNMDPRTRVHPDRTKYDKSHRKRWKQDLRKHEGSEAGMDRIARIASKIVADYPDSAPTEQDRKEWREEGEERRKKDGIKPRKESHAADGEKHKLALTVTAYSTGAVACGAVRYGPDTAVARFLKARIEDQNLAAGKTRSGMTAGMHGSPLAVYDSSRGYSMDDESLTNWLMVVFSITDAGENGESVLTAEAAFTHSGSNHMTGKKFDEMRWEKVQKRVVISGDIRGLMTAMESAVSMFASETRGKQEYNERCWTLPGRTIPTNTTGLRLRSVLQRTLTW